MGNARERIRQLARDRLGFDELRPGQEEAIAALLDGRDTLVVMPTGSGKSAIYQLASLLLAGPTVVVSPLLALQRDQVKGIRESGVAQAAALNSRLSEATREELLDDVADDGLELLFLAPEQLARDDTRASLEAARPSLFVVDEAHCVSEWGHDFRPEYLRLGTAIDELGHPRVLALTATASPAVRDEIVERLRLRHPHVVVRGFDRPNIRLAVERFEQERPKLRALVDATATSEKPGIVYAATRKETEALAEALAEAGVRAAPYHAGLRAKEREAVQESFMADKLEVVVATVAFGMGIDKPNVRFVFHADPSDSVDAYYQEIGRAGRDGGAARAVLFYRPQDLGVRRFFAGAGRVDADDVKLVAEAVADGDGPVDAGHVEQETGLTETKIEAALGRLEDVGAVDVLPTGEAVASSSDIDETRVAELAAIADERRHEFDRSRVEMMRGYAEAATCRREYVLNYFGEAFSPPCGRCDNCEAGHGAAGRVDAPPFPLGARVRHEAWGEGLVQRYESDKMVVLFDDVGYKTLAVPLVVEDHLLVPVGRDEPSA